jgi:SRSO17 transposase
MAWCRTDRDVPILLSHVFADSWRLWICYFADSVSPERRMAGTMEPWAQSSEPRFAEYVDALTSVIGREDRAGPHKDYCVGPLMPGERKSVEPMAAIVAPAQVSATHQSLLHLVGQAPWSDKAVLTKVRELVLPTIETQGKIEAWIVDDTGFAKKGVHSAGVARQYCGRLGKTDNCQIAVTLSIANHAASLPIAYQLYLPQDWAMDEARRKKARVSDDVTFRTKPEIALAQIRTALAAGVLRASCWPTLGMAPTARSAPVSRPAVWPMGSACSRR